MITEAKAVRNGLAELATKIERYAKSVQDLDQQRYALSSGTLVRNEEKKLEAGLLSNDNTNILWALRSVADMIKGLIDIGSDLREAEPSVWREAEGLAARAHVIERNYRLGR